MAPLQEPNIITLELVRGVPRAPLDPFTNEPQLDVLNLLNVRGFSVDYDGWTPQLPSLKNGGVWADSSQSAGRQLIAGEFDNVTETIRLHASGATMESRLFLKSRLWDFARRAKTFHTDWGEQQPVYLKWHAPNAPCAQYALVYNIDAAVENDAFDLDTDTVVITVEREPAWRGVPPGASPMEWTHFFNNRQRGQDYTYANVALDSTQSLVTDTVNNRHEWTYNGGSPVTTPTSKNYIEISADKIPGDAPALVSVGLHWDEPATFGGPLNRLLMWHSSKELSGVDQIAGTAMASGYIMNAIDMGGGGTPTAGTAVTGVFNTGAGPTKQYMALGLGGTGSQITLESISGASSDFGFWWRQLLRGRLAVFVRARALTGVATDVRLRVSVQEISNAGALGITQIDLPTVNVPLTTSTGEYALIYAGQITVPFEAKSHVGIDGRGLYLKKFVANTTPFDIKFQFRFENFTSPTGARTVHVLDAILVPIDEAFAEYRYGFSSASNRESFFLDNTGYLARGRSEDMSVRMEHTSYVTNRPANPIEQRGNMPTLQPRQTQRIYFLNTRLVAGETISTPDADMTVFVNIVPRWYGVAAL